MTELELGEQRAIELGLKRSTIDGYFYLAHDINRLLGSAKEVYGYQVYENNWGFREFSYLSYLSEDKGKSTHTALLFGVRPIVKESEERELLAEIVAYATDPRMTYFHDKGHLDSIANRAKKLLEKK